MHVASLKMMILCLVKVLKLKIFFRFHCENCRTPGSFALSRFLKGSSRSLGPRFQRATGARKQHQNDVPCRKGAKRLGEKLQLPKKHHNASNRWRIYFLPNLKRWRTLCAPANVCARQNLGTAGISTDRFVCQEAAGSSIEPEWSHREHLRTRCGRSNSHISLTWSTTFSRTPSCGLSERFKKKTWNINLEPVCPLFWWLNPPKQRSFLIKIRGPRLGSRNIFSR